MKTMTMTRSIVSQPVAAQAISEFVDGTVRKRTTDIPGGPVQQFVARRVPSTARGTVRMMLTDLIRPQQRARARSLLRNARGDVKVHLGSGELPRQGWINVDLLGVPVDLAWNLSGPLPFPDGSVDAVFHEHVLEHLAMDHGLFLVAECSRRVASSGLRCRMLRATSGGTRTGPSPQGRLATGRS